MTSALPGRVFKEEKMSVDAKNYVNGLMAKARAAQKQIEFKSQAEVDDICARLARSGTTEAFAKKIAELAVA